VAHSAVQTQTADTGVIMKYKVVTYFKFRKFKKYSVRISSKIVLNYHLS